MQNIEEVWLFVVEDVTFKENVKRYKCQGDN